jgi:hypothetical protein
MSLIWDSGTRRGGGHERFEKVVWEVWKWVEEFLRVVTKARG